MFGTTSKTMKNISMDMDQKFLGEVCIVVVKLREIKLQLMIKAQLTNGKIQHILEDWEKMKCHSSQFEQCQQALEQILINKCEMNDLLMQWENPGYIFLSEKFTLMFL